jgi:hypothetical protein
MPDGIGPKKDACVPLKRRFRFQVHPVDKKVEATPFIKGGTMGVKSF